MLQLLLVHLPRCIALGFREGHWVLGKVSYKPLRSMNSLGVENKQQVFLVWKRGRQGETTSAETVFLKGNSLLKVVGETVRPGEGAGAGLGIHC